MVLSGPIPGSSHLVLHSIAFLSPWLPTYSLPSPWDHLTGGMWKVAGRPRELRDFKKHQDQLVCDILEKEILN